MMDSLLLAGSAGLNATDHPLGYLAIAVFVLSYACVIFEEMLHMKKSKPVMLAAGLIWIIVGMIVLDKTPDESPVSIAVEQHVDNPSAAELQSVSVDSDVHSAVEIQVPESEEAHGKADEPKTLREEAFHHYNVEIKHLLVEFAELFFFFVCSHDLYPYNGRARCFSYVKGLPCW